jgi:hypothetical protein
MAKSNTFEAFTKKWISYVKDTNSIKEDDWNHFFAQSNPVAGIDRGALSDTYTDQSKKKWEVNERKTIKDNWSSISKLFLELYELKSDNDKKEKLRAISDYIINLIRENGGKRDPKVAINRILVTLFPEKLLTIPNFNDVLKLAELLEIQTDKKDWIDLCFEIKPILESKYQNKSHWGAYLQLVQESNLTNNFNLILTGAPGTGKTYLARQMAANIIGCKETELKAKPNFEFVQFHPSYDYSDFVEGLRPQMNGSFVRQDGVFKSFCARAAQDESTNKKYVFVIDEINRGEISKIFGELFFSIDPGYREDKDRILVRTQYQNLIDNDNSLTDNEKEANSDKAKIYYPFKRGFYVPSNVYVIGTMNDIDRSVESMDFAFRRRFSFYEIKATDTQYSILKDCTSMDEAIRRMNNLNKAIEKIDGLSSAFHIGAAYFIKINLYENKRDSWDLLWNNHLKGLLYEYLRGMPLKEIEKNLKNLKAAYDKKGEETNESNNSEE